MSSVYEFFIILCGVGLIGIVIIFFIHHVQTKRVVELLVERIKDLENENSTIRQNSRQVRNKTDKGNQKTAGH